MDIQAIALAMAPLDYSFEDFTDVLFHPFLMLWYGVITHHLKRITQIKQTTGKLLTPGVYLKKNWLGATTSVVGALVGYGALYSSEQLTGITAFGIGFVSDASADLIGAGASAAVLKGDNRNTGRDE